MVQRFENTIARSAFVPIFFSNFYKFIFLLAILACSTAPHHSSENKLDATQIKYRGFNFDIVQFQPEEFDLQFFLANKKGQKYRNFQKLKSDLKKDGRSLRFAMNGGMYLKDGSPQGLYIENGKQLKPVDTIQEAYGNFYLQPNGIFFIKNNQGQVLTTKEYLQQSPLPDLATQSGPMLVIHDTIHPVFVEGSKHLNIRNGVGIDSTGNIVFAISNEELNLYDFAMLFKEKLNCKNALYLDGAISQAYIPDLNRKQLGGNFGVIIGILEKD